MKKKLKRTDSADASDSEHELLHYSGNRVKLMQHVFKLIKAKKLLSMAPNCLKNMQISDIKSLLLEELLGISNKRLRYILSGINQDADSSTCSESDTEKGKQQEPIDIISLDDITDSSETYTSDDVCMEIQVSERERLEMEIEQSKTDKSTTKSKLRSKANKIKIKKEHSTKEKEKHRKKAMAIKKELNENENDPVMNALNLLELQARARAIRSQLANEVPVGVNLKENHIVVKDEKPEENGNTSDSEDSVIFVSPKDNTIVMVNLDSDNDENETTDNINQNQNQNDSTDANNLNQSEKEPEKLTDHDDASVATENKVTARDTNDVTAAVVTTEEEKVTDHGSNADATEDNVMDRDSNNDIVVVTEDKSIDHESNDDVIIVTEDTGLEKESSTVQENKNEDSENNTNSSTWKSRWLDSEKVQNVMRTTKFYHSIKKLRQQQSTSNIK